MTFFGIRIKFAHELNKIPESDDLTINNIASFYLEVNFLNKCQPVKSSYCNLQPFVL